MVDIYVLNYYRKKMVIIVPCLIVPNEGKKFALLKQIPATKLWEIIK